MIYVICIITLLNNPNNAIHVSLSLKSINDIVTQYKWYMFMLGYIIFKGPSI